MPRARLAGSWVQWREEPCLALCPKPRSIGAPGDPGRPQRFKNRRHRAERGGAKQKRCGYVAKNLPCDFDVLSGFKNFPLPSRLRKKCVCVCVCVYTSKT
jgi:hypothetical protein